MTRTHTALLSASAALLSALSAPAQSSIFDRDDRQYVSVAHGSPYSAVGIVSHRGAFFWYWGAGFLVDDCHVLTSQSGSHLGYGMAPVGKQVKFTTGVGAPNQQLTRGSVIAAGGLRSSRAKDQQLARNWLLLRLDKCIGASAGHVALSTGPYSPYEFRDLKTAGYPANRRKKPGITVDPSCSVLGSRGVLWMNDCAMVAGDGGNPVFRISASTTKPQMIVYAMQVGGLSDGNPVALKPGYGNAAVPMSLIAPQIQPYLSADLNKIVATR